MTLVAILALAAATPGVQPVEVSIPGPQGDLAGTFEPAAPGSKPKAVAVIIPGSGPTDRDGNNPLGVKAQPYRQLAQALAGKGIATVRIDKRGLFGSARAIPDPNKVTIADYAADVSQWANFAAKKSGARCAWLIGHSEGGLVAEVAAQSPKGICGVVLISAPGRPMAIVMREQLTSNPANAPILAPALAMIDGLEAGRTTDPATLPKPLDRMFPLPIQQYLIAEMKYDPAALAKSARLPVAIVQGDRDLQVSIADARRLAAAQPRASLAIVPGVNHVLKQVPANDRATNFRSYADPNLPIDPGVVDAVAAAIRSR